MIPTPSSPSAVRGLAAWRRAVATLIVAGAAALALAAQAALPPGVVQGPTVEGVTQYTLANGLKVLLFPDASKPTTTVNVTYLVGSRNEGYGETGMAHLLEHMVFKGTPSIPNVFQELGKRGIQFNGSTSFDRTNYYETFPANDATLAWTLAMEAERMTKSLFTKAELDTEMTVVRNEFETGENNPYLVLWKRLQAVAYDWHNYGNMPIGARSDIENVPFENLRAFYQRHYQPDNAVLIVAGKFDPAATLDLIAKNFGAIPRPTRALPALYTAEPVQDGERAVTVRRPGGNQLVAALYRIPQAAHPDYVALDALARIMTIQPSGRLYQALVDTKKATEVDTSVLALHDPGTLVFWVQVPPADSLDVAQGALLATIAGIADKPITDAEVDRVRTRAQKAFDDTINDPQRLGVALSESIAEGDWRLFFLQRDRWRTLKAADVQRAATTWLKPANLTIGRFIPDAQPDRTPAAAAVDVAKLVSDYRGDAAVAAGETFDPTPANLEARTKRVTLPGGMKLALLPKKNRGETVRFSLRLRFGDLASLAGTEPYGSLTAAMLSSGTQKRDRQAFNDEIDRLRAKLGFGGGDASVSAGGETVRANLEPLLRLAAEALRTPAFPAAEFDKIIREQVAAIDEARVDPEALAERAAERNANPYPKGDIRHVASFDDELAEVRAARLDAVRAFHARFYGAEHAELAVVGDFDADAVVKLAAELFGDWKSGAAYARVPYPYQATVPGAEVIATPEKANATLIGNLALPVRDTSPDFPALAVVDKLLGGGPESRLGDRVRERGGLSYSVGTALSPGNIDENSRWMIYATFAPENRDKLRAAVAEELARAVKDGFTPAEVDTAKRALLELRRNARAQDGAVVRGLMSQAYLDRTWAFAAETDRALAALTAEQVNAALRKYLKPDGFWTAEAGDFAKVRK